MWLQYKFIAALLYYDVDIHSCRTNQLWSTFAGSKPDSNKSHAQLHNHITNYIDVHSCRNLHLQLLILSTAIELYNRPCHLIFAPPLRSGLHHITLGGATIPPISANQLWCSSSKQGADWLSSVLTWRLSQRSISKISLNI